jgi:two-component system sensor histidine kinase DesK
MTSVIEHPCAPRRHDERMRYLRHFTAGSLLACVLLAVILVAATPAGAVPLVATLVAGSVAALLFLAGVHRTGALWARRLLPVGAAATVVAYAGMVATGVDIWPAVTVPALFVAAVLIGADWPRPQVTGIGLALVGLCATLAGSGWWQAVTAVAATGLCLAALMIQMWVWEIANRTAETAVIHERQRFAADLHDIQGHSLQVIALKSELAARLAATDPERAAAEMRGVQTLARDALRDTREVAQGYREVSLQTEIANAARVLAAAGVRCRIDAAAPRDLPPDGERLLALMVREATTNILRHSTARFSLDAELPR